MSAGDRDSCELRPDVEFLQHGTDLRADCGQGDEMSFGDLVCAETVDQRTEHKSLAVRQPFEGGRGTLHAGSGEPQLVEHRSAIGAPDHRSAGEDKADDRVDLVEHGTLADPTGSTGFDALRQHHAAHLGGQHHYLRTCRHQWLDELDPASCSAEVDVEEHALRLESLGMLDHMIWRRAANRLDIPTTSGQRQLQANCHQHLILDDEEPPAHRRTTGWTTVGRTPDG